MTTTPMRNTIQTDCNIHPSQIAQAQARYLLEKLLTTHGGKLEVNPITGSLTLKDHNTVLSKFEFDKTANTMTATFNVPIDTKTVNEAAIFAANLRKNERYQQIPISTAGENVNPEQLEQVKNYFTEQSANKDLEKKWTLRGLAIGHENREYVPKIETTETPTRAPDTMPVMSTSGR